MATRIVSMTLPVDLVARLDAVAEDEERSRSAVARRVLREALDAHAAVLAEAERRFRALRGGAPHEPLAAGDEKA